MRRRLAHVFRALNAARIGHAPLRALGTIVLLLAAISACGSKHRADLLELDAEGQPPAAAEPSSMALAKEKGRKALRDRPPGLVYRMANEQARQHLTAENAHLRLDELDALIEHEKEM